MLPVIASPPPVLSRPFNPQPVHGDGVSGDVVLLSDFDSQTLHNKRNIVVYLPPGYRDAGNTRQYTVLYAQDGQNLFDPATAFNGQEWHLDEWAEGLIQSHKIAPIIIVGVYNTPDRISEDTPVPDPDDGGGNADAYESFLIHELKPYVSQHFRVRPDSDHTGVMGSSLGGLVSLDTSFKHPDQFGRVGALSGSWWWDDEYLTKRLASGSGLGPQKIWIDMGTQEGKNPQANLQFAQNLHSVLQQRGYRDEQNLFYREIAGGTHDEGSWSRRIGDFLMAMFPPED